MKGSHRLVTRKFSSQKSSMVMTSVGDSNERQIAQNNTTQRISTES
jgi:hypothetical protein